MANKIKTNPVWNIDKKELENIAVCAKSFNDILRHFGLFSKSSSNADTLRRRIKEEKITCPLIRLGKGWNKGGTINFVHPTKKSIADLLREDSTYCRFRMKKRLLDEKVLDNKCYVCGQLPTWCGKPLTLTLDHINGNKHDNRLENLRILCWHCHSQTETFAGKKRC